MLITSLHFYDSIFIKWTDSAWLHRPWQLPAFVVHAPKLSRVNQNKTRIVASFLVFDTLNTNKETCEYSESSNAYFMVRVLNNI